MRFCEQLASFSFFFFLSFFLSQTFDLNCYVLDKMSGLTGITSGLLVTFKGSIWQYPWLSWLNIHSWLSNLESASPSFWCESCDNSSSLHDDCLRFILVSSRLQILSMIKKMRSDNRISEINTQMMSKSWECLKVSLWR